MKTTILLSALLLAEAGKPASGQPSEDSLRIVIQTIYGNIHAVLFVTKAPLTCANFLYYTDKIGCQGGIFYRTVNPNNQPHSVVKIEVIQGGFNLDEMDTSLIRPIPLERTNLTGILHENGTLSMARDHPDSGSTEFFICIGDQPSLDYGGKRNPDGQGFAVFGRVIRGMDVVKRIQSAPAEGQSLTPPVSIIRIEREQE